MTSDSDPPSRRADHPASLRELGELGLIERIRQAVTDSSGASGVRTGIGDDTAVLGLSPGAALLVTTDLLIEDVHFRRTYASARDIGWKALAVNLSDIAAMGGTPRWALIAIALPAATDVASVDAFVTGLNEAAAPHEVAVIGGDTSTSPNGWMVNVTLIGQHAGTPRLRSMAKAGDAIVVTGTLGRSAAGLALLQAEPGERARTAVPAELGEELIGAHLRPTARVAEGRWLGEQAAVHAMMDCSDGLATDLGHICRQSRVAARVLLERVPVAPAAQALGRALDKDPLPWAVAGGEDYELLATCRPEAVDELRAGLLAATGTALTAIGEITPGAGIRWVDGRGETLEIGAGYEHFGGRR